MLFRICTMIALCSFGLCASAHSATVSSIVKKDGKVPLTLDDEIFEGDSEKVKSIIKSANDAGRLVSGIRLNSKGGNLLEGVKIAEVVRYGKFQPAFKLMLYVHPRVLLFLPQALINTRTTRPLSECMAHQNHLARNRWLAMQRP